MLATLTHPAPPLEHTELDPCPRVCSTLLATIHQHAAGCTRYVTPYGKGWCPDCRKRVQIEDVSAEGTYTVLGEVEYRVEYLACGHTNAGPQRVIGPAPGAPYAGTRPGAPICPDPWANDDRTTEDHR